MGRQTVEAKVDTRARWRVLPTLFEQVPREKLIDLLVGAKIKFPLGHKAPPRIARRAAELTLEALTETGQNPELASELRKLGGLEDPTPKDRLPFAGAAVPGGPFASQDRTVIKFPDVVGRHAGRRAAKAKAAPLPPKPKALANVPLRTRTEREGVAGENPVAPAPAFAEPPATAPEPKVSALSLSLPFVRTVETLPQGFMYLDEPFIIRAMSVAFRVGRHTTFLPKSRLVRHDGRYAIPERNVVNNLETGAYGTVEYASDDEAFREVQGILHRRLDVGPDVEGVILKYVEFYTGRLQSEERLIRAESETVLGVLKVILAHARSRSVEDS